MEKSFCLLGRSSIQQIKDFSYSEENQRVLIIVRWLSFSFSLECRISRWVLDKDSLCGALCSPLYIDEIVNTLVSIDRSISPDVLSPLSRSARLSVAIGDHPMSSRLSFLLSRSLSLRPIEPRETGPDGESERDPERMLRSFSPSVGRFCRESLDERQF